MSPNHPLRVFLSYASQDREQVRELYDLLVKQGADPWFDDVKLLPGQDWNLEIRKGLDNADAILLCLSKQSVSKEGYIQKEMRLALDRGLEMPEGEIFLIPARLEECDLPYSMKHYQAVDVFTERGMQKLIQSLGIRAERVGANPLGGGKARKAKPVTPKEEADAKPSSGTVVNIHGNVSGSNIVIGNDNDVENK